MMNVSKIILLIVLVLSGFMQLVFGSWILLAPETIVPKFNILTENIVNDPGLMTILTMLGKFLLNFFCISILTSYFILKDNIAGVAFSLYSGLAMLIGGIISYSISGGVNFLFADSLRGAIVLLFTYFYYKQAFANHRVRHVTLRKIVFSEHKGKLLGKNPLTHPTYLEGKPEEDAEPVGNAH